MDAEQIFETCLPILKDDSLEEEDKTDKLEELVRKETKLTGKSLESTVLDVLWRYRNQSTPSTSPTVRHTVVRRNSPAPWQTSRSATPVAGSPRSAAPSPAPQGGGLGVRPALLRMKSSYTNQSPFGSPRASPRPSYLSPYVGPSPKMSFNYEPPAAPSPNVFDDYDPMSGEWLGGGSDDGHSVASGYAGDAGGEWMQPQMVEMSPYDILRSVLRDEKTDQEIEQILEASGYDLSAAIASLVGGGGQGSETSPEMGSNRTYLVGKSMAVQRPATPVGQSKTPVVCRYWLSTGQCLRADCRFSHDLSNVVCKYWLAGHCLAGEACIFSHDPSSLMGNMSLSEYGASPPQDIAQPQPQYQLQDYSSFPSLSGNTHAQSPGMESPLRNLYATSNGIAPPPGFSTRPALAPEFIPSRPQSRPASSRGLSTSIDEFEAFPSLGSAALRAGRKHHGKRGHGHSHKDKEPTSTLSQSSSLADIVRSAPNPPPTAQSPRRSLRRPGSYTGTREHTLAASSIPTPQHIPWLETGEKVNRDYLKARNEAIKHGSARNKFLQSAAQAWNRNDVRAAKALSLRGQNENELMRTAHRVAAKYLYDERNASTSSAESKEGEIYIDLHGLHPAEAVSYLATALSTRRSAASVQRDEGEGSRRGVLYAIVGSGTHSKNGRDKVGKAVRAYLNECRYAWREFGPPAEGVASSVGVPKDARSVSGSGAGGTTAGGGGGMSGSVSATGSPMLERTESRNANPGGILGIDALSGDLSTVKSAETQAVAVALAEEGEVESERRGSAGVLNTSSGLTLHGRKLSLVDGSGGMMGGVALVEDEDQGQDVGGAREMNLADALKSGKVGILKAGGKS